MSIRRFKLNIPDDAAENDPVKPRQEQADPLKDVSAESEISTKDKKANAIRKIVPKRILHQSKPKINVRRIEHSRLRKREPAQAKLVRISDLTLDQLVEKAKTIHPLPRERQMKIKPTHRNWLIAQLRKANNEEKLHDFAYSLTHKELALLFPVLATTHKPITAERIKTIIRLRASKSLYFHGWITWQFIYPDNRLAKSLTELCEVLADQKLPGQKLAQDLIIERESDISILPYPHFNWPEIRLISDLIMPDNRRFMSHIINHLLENNIELEDFLAKFAIYDDLALGKAIINNYRVEKVEYQFKSQVGKKESFSWQDFFGLAKETEFTE